MTFIRSGLVSVCAFFLLTLTPFAQVPTLDFAQIVGGTDSDSGYAIALGPDKNVFVAGAFGGTVDFDPGPGDASRTSAGGDDVFVAKYDSSGNFLQVWIFGGADTEEPYYIDVDAYGGFHVCGEFYGTGDYDPGPATFNLTSAGQNDFFLVYVDGNGDLGYAYQWGTAQEDYIGNFRTDRLGNAYFAGSYNTDPMDADPTAGVFTLPNATNTIEGFLLKLSYDGTLEYAVSLSNANSVYIDSLAVDRVGNAYIVTEFANTLDVDPGPGVYNLSSPGKYSIGVVKLDSNGDFVDAAIVVEGVDGSSFGVPYHTDVDQHGNIYMTGYFRNSMDFDPSGSSLIHSNFTGRSIFVLKLTRDYALTYAHAFGSGLSGNTNGANILSNKYGAAYMVGRFSGTVDFDPGAGVTNLSATTNYTPVIMNLEPDGSLGWAFTIDGSDDGSAYDLALDRDNELYVSGSFKATGDFEPGAGTLNLTSAGDRDVWFAHYGPDANVITTPAPYVIDIELDNSKAAGDPQYVFNVTFSEAVTGVDVGDFQINGTATGTITGFTGSGANYQVTIDVAALTGIVYLDLIDNDSILSAGTSAPLGEAGPFNGDFYDGEVALVDQKDVPVPVASGFVLLLLVGAIALVAYRRTAALSN